MDGIIRNLNILDSGSDFSSHINPSLSSVVDPVTGIIPSVFEDEMTRSDPEVFIVATGIADTTVYGLRNKVIGNGSGAGLTFDNAWAAAVGEGIERYATSIVHPEDLILGSFDELYSHRYHPVQPDKWALFHQSQYTQLPFSQFRNDTRIAWIACENLTHKREQTVPACMVYIPYYPQFAKGGEKIVTSAISTGCACAISRSESLLKGICELVERDAFMIMWRNRLSLPRVNIDSESSIYNIFQTKFIRPGLQYTLVHTTLDLSIPSFFGILTDTRGESTSIVVGGAAHPDPDKAALKTILELVQGLRWKDYIKPQKFTLEHNFQNVRSFDDRARLYAFNDMHKAFEFIWTGEDEVSLSEITSLDNGNTHDNLHNCISILAKRDLETLALDLTPVDIESCGMYVTRVLIPGCETMEGDHRFQFLGGTRWRQVPFDLGLSPTITKYESQNPYPHPYP